MKRYAFIKDNLPELKGKIMVVLVQAKDGETIGDVIDVAILNDQDSVRRYLDEQVHELRYIQ